ncbi:hypothetical protein T05_11538 [Trichinella murrelli]|uniref:Uncharacterized protein n=1 Tax=Trichinella murrelli TaxID=144512 RepID=A0A0V0T6J2_9BILA|nr:hypothetical protein T05_14959 [Trichinella murrelli]KRX34584.1 hypothetical protein T05_11538 [Trichinella murrelli]
MVLRAGVESATYGWRAGLAVNHMADATTIIRDGLQTREIVDTFSSTALQTLSISFPLCSVNNKRFVFAV